MPPAPTSTPTGDDMHRVVAGYVVGGGDTTPTGLTDAPRKFVYQVRTDVGSLVQVTYTAFPPSPRDDQTHGIRLSFHAGSILIGDYLRAQGHFDERAGTLTVAQEGDYIETYPSKP